MIGRTLGHCRIIEQIGMGGMATVYKAYDPATDRYVAIKVLPSHFSQDATFRERFEREAKAIAKLEHIHILPIFTYGEEDGIAYMAMRYLQTGTLTDLIRQGPLSLAEASRLLNQIAAALDYAHSHNVLHRDVKPSNVLLDTQGNAFLTDFGIAKMIESTLDLTGAGILGTPAYMSPEQCRGSKELTPATDQYSLGIVVYEMITGRTPYQAETPIALIHMQLSDSLPLPRTIRPDLPEEAERTILKALAKEPNARYPTCSDFAAAFAQAVHLQQPAPAVSASLTPPPDETLIATTDTPTVLHQPQPASKTSSSRWIWGAVAVLVILGLLAGGGIFAFLSQDKASSPPPPEAVSQTQPTAQPPTEPTATQQVDQAQPTVQGEVVAHPLAAEPPAEALEMVYQLWPNRTIEPCNWVDIGSGLCLLTWVIEVEPVQILANSGLEFFDTPGFSPNGEQIAFSAAPLDSEDTFAEANIFTANIDGSNLTELPLPGSQTAPAWSPNGDWLTFVHDGQLALMRSNGDDLQTILELEAEQCVSLPQWSPDGQKIVVSVQEICEDRLPITRHIWLVADQGQSVTPLATTVYNNRDCVNFATAFTPDGQQVAYLDQECQTQLISADGSGELTPTEDFPWSWRSNVFPPWQEFREVDRCEYQAAGGPGECIYSDYRQLSRILEDTTLDLDRLSGPYSWSPDGQQLAFSGAEPDAPFNSLYTINVDGSNLNQLPLAENAEEPVWSPDGQWLAFHYISKLAIAHPDGSELTILHEGQDCVSRLGWSPDSQWLVASIMLDPSDCEVAFPQTRGVWLVSLASGEIIPLAEITYPRECDEYPARVAFNRTGQYVAYIDADCRPVIVNIDNPQETITLPEFPWWWENNIYPQWGGLPN